MQTHDAIIIGGGHNGLACAAYLARAGMDVLVLERKGVLGGASVTDERWPGYHISSAAYVVSLMPPEVVKELEATMNIGWVVVYVIARKEDEIRFEGIGSGDRLGYGFE